MDKRWRKGWLLLGFFILGLAGINADLFRFSFVHPYPAYYSPAEESAGIYPVSALVTLRPGSYDVTLEGSVDGEGCSLLLTDSNGAAVSELPLTAESFSSPMKVLLTQGQSLRFSVHYVTEAGALRLDSVGLSSNRVLTKESLLCHGTLTMLWVLTVLWLGLRLFGVISANRVRERTVLILLGASLLSCLAFLDPNIIQDGDDLFFHLERIEGIAADFRAGIFPPKIYLNWMNNYGVGAGFYYPDLFLYLPALGRLLGFSLFTVFKGFNLLCSLLSAVTMYLCASRLSGSVRTGRLAAVFYVLAPYRLICMIYRTALGEVQAFIFFPLIVWGLYEMFKGAGKGWKLLALGFWGLLCSHLVSLAIAGVLTALYLLIRIRDLFRNRRLFTDLLKAFGCTLFAGAFFLLPFVEQSLKNDLRVNEIIYYEGVTYGWRNMHKFKNLFQFFDSWEFLEDRAEPYPGWLFLLMVPFRLFLARRKVRVSRMADGFFLSGLLLLWVSTDWFPWGLFSCFLLKIQFSWRLLLPAALLLCLATAMYVSVADRRWARYAALGLCLLSALPMEAAAWKVHGVPVRLMGLNQRPIDGYEYTPRGADWDYTDQTRDRVMVTKGVAEVTDESRRDLSFSFAWRDGRGSLQFDLPLLYYASYESSNGDVLRQSERGLVSFETDEAEGAVTVRFVKSLTQRVSEWISVVTMAVILLYLLYHRKL